MMQESQGTSPMQWKKTIGSGLFPDVQLKQTTISYYPPNMVEYEMEGKTVGLLAGGASLSVHLSHKSRLSCSDLQCPFLEL